MTIKIVFEQHLESSFDCECCGVCYPDHWTISLVINEQDYLVWEHNHDGHMGGYETEGCIVTLMRNILLDAHGGTDNGSDYQRKSIIDCHAQVEGFVQTLYNPWSKAKAYALVLEDDGWDILIECSL